MSFKKEYIQVVTSYFVLLLYIIFGDNKAIMAISVFAVGSLTIYILIRISSSLNIEREKSVSSLQTKLAKSKKENEEAYKRFLSLSTTLGSGVFMVDEEGFISFSNKDVENYFGIDISNKDYKELVDIKQLYYFIDETYLLEEYHRKQIKHEEKVYDLISTPLFEGDMYAGCLVLVHDITQLKVAEKFQKRFTADVSHELKTPLSAIKGYSEILQRDQKMDPIHKKEFIDTINEQANKMEAILNDLIVISKLDRIDYEMDLQFHDISDVIKESTNLLQSKILEKELGCIVKVESCKMYFDKVKLSQVIINIVKNAINYTDKGFVNISGKIKNNKYIIKIEDSGIGIKNENLDKIFTRFYRVDTARSRDTGGSGLGLSISKNVVLKHGGKIDVKSVENQGSTFIITLPIKK
jgi:two-component system phosphate regulon sensor histidine kinase PhoR